MPLVLDLLHQKDEMDAGFWLDFFLICNTIFLWCARLL